LVVSVVAADAKAKGEKVFLVLANMTAASDCDQQKLAQNFTTKT